MPMRTVSRIINGNICMIAQKWMNGFSNHSLNLLNLHKHNAFFELLLVIIDFAQTFHAKRSLRKLMAVITCTVNLVGFISVGFVTIFKFVD